MKLNSWVIAVFPALLLAAGCAHKPKTAEPLGTEVSNQDMQFSATGSDAGNIPGLSSIHFDFDKSTLTPQARQLLAEDAKWMTDHPKARIQVEGHTDARGSTEYNLALGERRAKAAMSYMVNLGVSRKRLSTISYGSEKPLDTGTTEEAYAKNRRDNMVPSDYSNKLSEK